MSTVEDRAPKADIYKRIAAQRLGELENQLIEQQAIIILRDQFIQSLKSQLQQAQGEIAALKAAPPSEVQKD